MLYISFAPACLASLECLLPRLLACILDNSINSFIEGCKEFETCTYTVFQNCIVFPVFVSISCIGTVFLYSCRYHVSVPFSYIVLYDSDIYCTITWNLTLACYYMTPVWYHLSPVILNTWHTWLIIITYRNDDLISWHALICSSTHILIIHLACSCSFPYIDNYRINYKKDNLHREGRNWMDTGVMLCL